MDGTFGWKVPRMVHGKRCMAFFYTPVGIRKAKRKAFLVPGCRMWTLEYLATQKVTRYSSSHSISVNGNILPRIIAIPRYLRGIFAYLRITWYNTFGANEGYLNLLEILKKRSYHSSA